MSGERLPLLSDQYDRLLVGDWIDRQGLGADVRMFGSGFRLTGPLHVDALRSVLTALVARHEALRVAFPDRGLSGYQIVCPPPEVELTEWDLRDLPDNERWEEAARIVGERLSKNVDLEAGLLLSAALVRLGDEDHLLGLAADHLVVDGEALELLVGELWSMYAAKVGGQAPNLPEQQSTYSDFVRWEADWLRRDPAARQAIALMAQRLDGLGVNPPVLLPGAKRETNQAYTVGSMSGSLPDDTVDVLSAHCQASRTTPFVTLLSAYLCALHVCGNPTDLGLNIPVTRRTEPHLFDLVCALSTHATTRVRLDLSLPFLELTRRVRASVLETFRLGQVPAPAVMATLAPHMLGRLFERPSGFFDVSPAWWSGSGRRVAALSVEPVNVRFQTNQIESLAMFASVIDRRVAFTVLYPADVFDDVSVGDLVRVFTSVVHRCLSEPRSPVGTLLPSLARG